MTKNSLLRYMGIRIRKEFLTNPLGSGCCARLVVKGQCDYSLLHEQQLKLWEPPPHNLR